MSTSNRTTQGKRVVCFCYNVSEDEIIAAIQAGATSLMEVRRETNANTGCGGCGEDVKKLLRKHVPRTATEPRGEDPTDG